MKISEVGEFPLIARIMSESIYDDTSVLQGIGDDGAVYRNSTGCDQVVSIDTMVEGIHFSKETMSAYDVGYRLTAANFSDMAAMGASPRQVVISVAAPVDYEAERLEDVYKGIKAMCHAYHVNIIGGDTVSTQGPLVLSMTVIGEVEAGQFVLRSGACTGDYIAVTGYLGLSAVGLAALQNGVEGYEECKKQHQRPEPQVALGKQLAAEGVSAMNDISDGLASELHEIATSSQKRLYIFPERIPIHKEVEQWGAKRAINPLDYAFYGGEDFQLVFTFPKEHKERITACPKVTVIGYVGETGHEVIRIQKDGSKISLPKKGYSHFLDK